MRTLISARAAMLVLIMACDSTGPDDRLVVDRVDLSSISVTLGPGATHVLVATPRAANGQPVAGKHIAWSSDREAIATVSATGEVRGLVLGTGTIRAAVDGKSAQASVVVIPTAPQHLAASWRMESFDGHTLPAAYAIFYDEPVGDRIIAKVELRLDSASQVMTANGDYLRKYHFTELHDDVPQFRYGWLDHGRFALGAAAVPVSLMLTSEFIQNLTTPGSVRTDGRLALDEELWHGEARHATLWVRRPG